MRKIREYANEMAEFAEPYVRSAGARMAYAAGAVQKGYRKNKKKIKRKMKMRKVKNVLEGTVGLILILAVLLALIAAVAEGCSRAWQSKKYIRL